MFIIYFCLCTGINLLYFNLHFCRLFQGAWLTWDCNVLALFIYFSFTLLCSVFLSRGCELCFSPKPPLWAVQPFCPLHSSAIFRYCSLSCCRRLVAQWLTGLWDNRAPSSLPLASIYSRQRLLSAPGPRSGPALLSRVWVFMLCVLGLAPIPHQSSACEGELRAQTGFNHLYRRKERQRECLGYYKTDHSNHLF